MRAALFARVGQKELTVMLGLCIGEGQECSAVIEAHMRTLSSLRLLTTGKSHNNHDNHHIGRHQFRRSVLTCMDAPPWDGSQIKCRVPCAVLRFSCARIHDIVCVKQEGAACCCVRSVVSQSGDRI